MEYFNGSRWMYGWTEGQNSMLGRSGSNILDNIVRNDLELTIY